MPQASYVRLTENFGRFGILVHSNTGVEDDSVIQLNANKAVGGRFAKDQFLAGKVARALHLKSAEGARAANNEIRSLFLKSVGEEFGGIESIPESVRTALKMKDFGDVTVTNGVVTCSSGRPLTMRRIREVVAAVEAARRPEMARIADLKREADNRFGALAKDQLTLVGSPFVEGGKTTELGRRVMSFVSSRYNDAYARLVIEKDKEAFLRNFDGQVRTSLGQACGLIVELRQQLDGLLDPTLGADGRAKGAFASLVTGKDPEGGAPSAELQKTRRRLLPDVLAGNLIDRFAVTPSRNKSIRSTGEIVDLIRDFMVGKDGVGPSEALKQMAARCDELAADEVRVSSEIEERFGVALDDETRRAPTAFRQTSRLGPTRPDFVALFGACLNACGRDPVQAQLFYRRLLKMDEHNLRHLPEASRLFGAIGRVDVSRRVVGKEAFRAELAVLAETLYSRVSKDLDISEDGRLSGRRTVELEHVTRNLVALLACRNPEVASFLKNVPDDVTADLCAYLKERSTGGGAVLRLQFAQELARVAAMLKAE